jgi:hypothetical protein
LGLTAGRGGAQVDDQIVVEVDRARVENIEHAARGVDRILPVKGQDEVIDGTDRELDLEHEEIVANDPKCSMFHGYPLNAQKR